MKRLITVSIASALALAPLSAFAAPDSNSASAKSERAMTTDGSKSGALPDKKSERALNAAPATPDAKSERAMNAADPAKGTN